MQQCEKCSFESKSSIGLSRHFKQKHGMILSTPQNTCSHCKKVFTSSSGLKNHVAKRVCLPKIQEPVVEPLPPAEPEATQPSLPPLLIVPSPTPTLESFPVSNPPSPQAPPPKTFISIFIRIAICSVFFIPFFIKEQKEV